MWGWHDVVLEVTEKKKKLRLGSKDDEMREVVEPGKRVNFVGQLSDLR